MATMNELLSKMKNIIVQKKAIELYKPPKSRGNVCSYTNNLIINLNFFLNNLFYRIKQNIQI